MACQHGPGFARADRNDKAINERASFNLTAESAVKRLIYEERGTEFRSVKWARHSIVSFNIPSPRKRNAVAPPSRRTLRQRGSLNREAVSNARGTPGRFHKRSGIPPQLPGTRHTLNRWNRRHCHP